MTAYEQGFATKCAEYGIDTRELCKRAGAAGSFASALGSMLKGLGYTAKGLGQAGVGAAKGIGAVGKGSLQATNRLLSLLFGTRLYKYEGAKNKLVKNLIKNRAAGVTDDFIKAYGKANKDLGAEEAKVLATRLAGALGLGGGVAAASNADW
jgi:hypothetical protein